MSDIVERRDSDYPMNRAAQIAAEVLDLHEKGQTLEGGAWEANADAYRAKCIGGAAILAVKLQDALAEIERLRASRAATVEEAIEVAQWVCRINFMDRAAQVHDKIGERIREHFSLSPEGKG